MSFSESREDWIVREVRQRPLATSAQADTATGPESCGPTAKLDFESIPNETARQRIDRYKVLEKIGEGGCGTVYVAEQEQPVRRRVALKLIKLGLDTKQVVARFEAERQALAIMDHPNIAKVFDGGATESGRLYFAMELVRGVKITDYCDNQRLTVSQRLGLFTAVCQAIQHAHQKGIIHRDIKPSNILVTLLDGEPVPKVIDFGIAKAIQGRLSDQTVYTELHQFIGTPAYTSPEQAEMSGLDIDTRSDIYSLGVLLYELLTGKTPFDARELMAVGLDELRRTLCQREPVRPSTRLSTLQHGELAAVARQRRSDPPKLIHFLRGDLDWIVMKCLEKDRSRRYETANLLAMDIQRYLASEPVLARPPSALYRLEKLARRHRVVFGATAAVSLALVLGLGFALTGLGRARTERGHAIQALQQAEVQRRRAEENARTAARMAYASDMSLAQVALAEGNLGRATMLLERHQPIDNQEDLRAWEWRYWWGQSRSRELAQIGIHPTTAVSGLAFSPDGGTLVSAGLDGGVCIWDVHKRQQVGRVPGRQSPLSLAHVHVSWLADGESVVIADDQGVRVAEALTGQIRNDFPRASGMAVSARGNALAIAATNGIEVFDTARWNEVGPVFAGLTAPMSLSADGAVLVARAHSEHVEIWDVTAHRPSQTALPILAGPTFSMLLLSPDAQHLAVKGREHTPMVLWDLQTGQNHCLAGHRDDTISAAFSRDGQRLATFSLDHTIKLWDTRTGTNLVNLLGHKEPVYAGAFSPDGGFLATSGIGGAIKLWSLGPTPVERDTLDEWVPLGLSKDSSSMIVMSTNGSLHEVRMDNLEEIRSLPLNLASIRNSLPNPDRIEIAAVSTDARLLALDLGPGKQKAHRIEVLYTATAAHLIEVPGQGYFCNWDTAFSDDNRYLAVQVGNPDQVQLWDLATSKMMTTFPGALGPVAISHSNELLMTGSREGLTLWNIVTRRTIKHLRAKPMVYYGVGFSPDDRLAGITRFDNQVLLWDLSSDGGPTPIGATRSPSGYVVFSPDGRNLATVAESVKLYSVPALQEISTLPLPSLPSLPGVSWVRFSPDGETLVGSFWEYSRPLESRFFATRLWRAPSWEKIGAADSASAYRGNR